MSGLVQINAETKEYLNSKRNNIKTLELLQEVTSLANETSDTKYTKKDVHHICKCIFECIVHNLNNRDNVNVSPYIKFETAIKNGKVCRNPKDPDKTIYVAPRYGVRVKLLKAFKDIIADIDTNAVDKN